MRYKYTDPTTMKREFLEIDNQPNGSIVRIAFMPPTESIKVITSDSAFGITMEPYIMDFKVDGDILHQVVK